MVEDGRTEPRSRMLRAAKLRVTGGPATNVTIRNLSSTGALVEASRVPGKDSEVELIKGELASTGIIAWATPGRCGISFHAPIDLAAWLPGQIHSVGQQRVDDVQASIRAGKEVASTERKQSGPSQLNVSARVAEELGYVSRLLEELGDKLSTDQMASRHGAQLQNLDVAIQLLGHLAEVLTAPDAALAIKRIGMEELRRRLLRRAL